MGNAWTKNQEQKAKKPELVVEPQSDANLTCEICIEPIETPNKKMRNRDLCSHPYCIKCVITYIKTKLGDNVSQIPCPDPDCPNNLNGLFFATIIPQPVFVKWCDLHCESTFLGVERRYCPYRDCSALVVNECGGILEKEKCPNCKRLFCFKCNKKWHAGFKCGELKDQNDDAFVVLAKRKGWARCPLCFYFVQRISGCTPIKCRCNAYFCYRCGELLYSGPNRCHCMFHNPNWLVISALAFYLVSFGLMGMSLVFAFKTRKKRSHPDRGNLAATNSCTSRKKRFPN